MIMNTTGTARIAPRTKTTVFPETVFIPSAHFVACVLGRGTVRADLRADRRDRPMLGKQWVAMADVSEIQQAEGFPLCQPYEAHLLAPPHSEPRHVAGQPG